MLKRLTLPMVPFAPTALRVAVGLVFMMHGLLKLQNPAGFIGFVGSLGFPVPAFFGWLVILLEAIGGLLLIVGAATRPTALLLAGQMLITAFYVKAARGGALITPAGQPGVGYELDLVLLGACLALTALGAGQLSVDENVLARTPVRVPATEPAMQ